MPDFQFLQDSLTKTWTILAPKRQLRPNIAHNTEAAVCPFCPGREATEEEMYRIGGEHGDTNWQVLVLKNKFPFAPHHEIIIHSPDHHKNIDELPLSQVVLLLHTYRQRFAALRTEGKVYIFHNHGIDGGESLTHPHTQLVVIPEEVTAPIPSLEPTAKEHLIVDQFVVFCPQTSQWPDEVWIAPRSETSEQTKQETQTFGKSTDAQLENLAFVLQRVVQLLDMRHGHEFPFNFYISPEEKWYLRIVPRIKRLGGFEIGTGIMVNTQDPQETIQFIKEHFENPDMEKIQRENRAEYARGV